MKKVIFFTFFSFTFIFFSYKFLETKQYLSFEDEFSSILVTI